MVFRAFLKKVLPEEKVVTLTRRGEARVRWATERLRNPIRVLSQTFFYDSPTRVHLHSPIDGVLQGAIARGWRVHEECARGIVHSAGRPDRGASSDGTKRWRWPPTL